MNALQPIFNEAWTVLRRGRDGGDAVRLLLGQKGKAASFMADLGECFGNANSLHELEIGLRYLAADYELSTPKEEVTS